MGWILYNIIGLSSAQPRPPLMRVWMDVLAILSAIDFDGEPRRDEDCCICCSTLIAVVFFTREERGDHMSFGWWSDGDGKDGYTKMGKPKQKVLSSKIIILTKSVIT